MKKIAANLALPVLLIALGCSGDKEQTGQDASVDSATLTTTNETGISAPTGDTASVDLFALDLVPDFSLPDVNETSPTFGTDVSPRQFSGTATAWYFSHAT